MEQNKNVLFNLDALLTNDSEIISIESRLAGIRVLETVATQRHAGLPQSVVIDRDHQSHKLSLRRGMIHDSF
jgi:hypothetical protein